VIFVMGTVARMCLTAESRASLHNGWQISMVYCWCWGRSVPRSSVRAQHAESSYYRGGRLPSDRVGGVFFAADRCAEQVTREGEGGRGRVLGAETRGYVPVASRVGTCFSGRADPRPPAVPAVVTRVRYAPWRCIIDRRRAARRCPPTRRRRSGSCMCVSECVCVWKSKASWQAA